jgi:pimeloyl-ACP methyl ester carboxylesterase
MRESALLANGVTFAVLEDGPEDGRLALCLHGFPDSAWTWRHLLPLLAGAGYRAVAPFLRGYAPTQTPRGASYTVGDLADDVCALHDALGGGSQATLIGHDWGAAAAYGAVERSRERWSALVTMAVPPTGSLAIDLISWAQMKRSWYSYLFQLPVAEALVAADDLAFVERLWADWSPGYDASADLARAKDALRNPENLAAAIRYYRDTPSEIRKPSTGPTLPDDLSFLYLHGARDGCIGVDVVDLAGACFPANAEIEILDGAGHFLQLERPADVGARILAFLAR